MIHSKVDEGQNHRQVSAANVEVISKGPTVRHIDTADDEAYQPKGSEDEITYCHRFHCATPLS